MVCILVSRILTDYLDCTGQLLNLHIPESYIHICALIQYIYNIFYSVWQLITRSKIEDLDSAAIESCF